jgi:hypothetical protein
MIQTFVTRCFSKLLGLLLLAGVITCLGQDPAPTPMVAKVDGLDLNMRAFTFFLKEARSEILSEIGGREGVNPADPNLWNSDIDGVKAGELVKQRALDKAKEYYALVARAVTLGVTTPQDDPFYLPSMAEMQKNKTIYGPRQLSEMMVVSAFRDELREKVKDKAVPVSLFPDEALKSVYDQHPEKSHIRSVVMIRKIYLSYQPENKAEKLQLMEKFLSRLKAGENFQKIAAEFSEKHSENRWVNYDDEGRQFVIRRPMEDRFLQSHFMDMAPGEMRGVADNGKGLYIVKCEKASDLEISFTEAKSSIMGMMRDKQYAAFTQELTGNAKIELNRPVYDAVRVD